MDFSNLELRFAVSAFDFSIRTGCCTEIEVLALYSFAAWTKPRTKFSFLKVFAAACALAVSRKDGARGIDILTGQWKVCHG